MTKAEIKHGRWEEGGYAYGETEWKCSVDNNNCSSGGVDWACAAVGMVELHCRAVHSMAIAICGNLPGSDCPGD